MRKTVAIVGAGVTGLVLGWRLSQSALASRFDFSILEASCRPGGCIWTEREGDWVIELGPNGFLDGNPSTLELCQELAIADQLLEAKEDAARRYLRVGERLVELPRSLSDFLRSPLLDWKSKARVIGERWVRAKPDGEDESIADFAARRFGPSVVRLADAMTTGVFGGDSRRLSAASCFPRLAAMEREAGSIAAGMKQARQQGRRGMGRLRAPTTGMRAIVDALADKLTPYLRLNSPVDSLAKSEGGFRISIANGDTLHCDHLILACPASSQAQVLARLDPKLANELGDIEYAAIAVATLGFPLDSVGIASNAFGYLSPRDSGSAVLGTIFTSSVFPARAPSGQFQFRSMLGGESAAWPQSRIVETVHNELKLLLGIRANPTFVHVHAWPRAIPQYEVGWPTKMARIDKLLQAHGGLHLAGSSRNGVAVNDCVANANRIAATLLASMTQP